MFNKFTGRKFLGYWLQTSVTRNDSHFSILMKTRMMSNFSWSSNGKSNFPKSSLYVSSRYGQEICRVIQPSYDSEYLNFLADNIEEVKSRFTKRFHPAFVCDNDESLQESLKQFAICIQQTDSLKKKRNRMINKIRKKRIKEGNDNVDQALENKLQKLFEEFDSSRTNLFKLEEKLIPFLLSLPNKVESMIEPQPKILDQSKKMEEFDGPNCHSYVRLGYINNLYDRSIVGPNANYLTDQGSMLYYSLIDMFCDQLEQSNYVPINGLDIVKSAIVEAVNYRDFSCDPFMLQLASGRNEENQRFHLVGESSLESFCAFLNKYHKQIGEQRKFYQIGSSFESSANSTLEQKHIIRWTLLADDNESNQLIKDQYKFYWSLLEPVGLRRCLLKSDIESLYRNEYDKYFLMSWLRSKNDWIQIGQIVHYHDYIGQRLGLDDWRQHHLISSTIDLIPLIYSLVEQYQHYETGHLRIPTEIKKYYF